MPKCLQKRLLESVLSLRNVPDDTDQRPVYTAAVTDDQFFKSVKISGLHPGHQTSVWVNFCPFRGVLLGEGWKGILEGVHVPWLNVRGRPEAHLQSIQEVVQRRHSYCLQNVLFGEAVANKFIDILAADPETSTCKFEREVQKGLRLLWKIGFVMVQRDLVGFFVWFASYLNLRYTWRDSRFELKGTKIELRQTHSDGH